MVMRTASATFGACCSALLLIRVGSAPKAAPGRLAALAVSQPQPAYLQDQVWHGNRLFEAGRFLDAAQVYENGHRSAKHAGHLRLQLRFLNNLAGCRLATLQYRDALQAYWDAQQVARRIQDWEAVSAISSNIASVYAQAGDIETARQAAEQALVSLKGQPAHQARLWIRVASLRARQGDMEGAIPLFARGIEEADRQGDRAAQAQAWNLLGYELLRRGELPEAERAMLEDFRLRRFNGNKDIHLAYRNLGMLRMAQGDLRSAERLLDEALAAARRSPSFVPLWPIYLQRGRLRVRQGRLGEALADFRAAVDIARRWRLEALPAESFRVSLDVGLHQLYSDLVDTAAALYFKTGRRELAREAFEAAEESRAASLRASLEENREGFPVLPAEYGEALAELHAAEIALLRADTPPARARLGDVRRRLTEIELRTGLALASSQSFRWDANHAGLLERTRKLLGPDEAFLAFDLGETTSYLWAVAREGFRLHRLPPRARISGRVQAFVAAVRDGSSEVPALGSALFRDLFGSLGARVRDKPHWLLALDGVLFELPMAALLADSRFLVERHSLQIVPSAHLLGPAPPGGHPELFVGLGDAVHNAADPRWKGPRQRARAATEAALELPRLPGSGREIRACAKAWASSVPPLLLVGPDASAETLRGALAKDPAVVHLATHVVASRQALPQGLISLGLQPNGELQLLGPAAIRSWRLSARLVVMSGCSSGQGPALPGAGLMGLTRAWLAAGAGAVLASRWATPDDSGELFLALYRHLREPGASPQVALQRAQQDMLRSGTWRSTPRYWAAYFVVGRG